MNAVIRQKYTDFDPCLRKIWKFPASPKIIVFRFLMPKSIAKSCIYDFGKKNIAAWAPKPNPKDIFLDGVAHPPISGQLAKLAPTPKASPCWKKSVP